MSQVFKIFLGLTCLVVALSYPVNTWRSISMPLSNHQIVSSITNTELDGSMRAYVLIVANDGLTASVRIFNLGLVPPTLLATKSFSYGLNPISSPSLFILSSVIHYYYIHNGNQWISQLPKSSLMPDFYNLVAGAERGVYLKDYGYLMSIREIQRVIDQPQVSLGTTMGSYDPGTAFPEKIKNMVSRTQNKVATLYGDKLYISMRSFSSNINTLATGFSSPQQIVIPRQGYFCSCLNSDQTILYFLDSGNFLMSANMGTNLLSTVGSVSLTAVVIDCYFDLVKNAIVFVKADQSMDVFDPITMSFVSSNSSSFDHFRVDEGRFVTRILGEEIIITAMCQPGNFYDIGLDACAICPAGCTLCQSSTFCTECIQGYSLESNNTCVPCPAECTLCQNTTFCTLCTTNYTLENNTCVLIPANVSIPDNVGGEKTIFEELLISLLQNDGITFVNRIPGGRKVLPFLTFLINIDELWLYQYHERDYGELMSSLFESVQRLENQKWKLLEDRTTELLYAKAGTSKDAIYGFIDTKRNYTSPRFREAEDRGETFLPACWEFVEFNLIVVLLGFLLLRWGARLLRRWRIAQCLRPFRTAAYLTPLLLDGNLQYFFFLLFSQVRLGFSLSPRDKMLNVLNYLFYFIVFWASVVSCFFAFWTARRLSEYLLDNWRTRVRGLLAHSLTGAVRALVLGAVHSLLRESPFQLPLLLGVEVLYVALLVLFMSYWRAHRVAFRVCFAVCFSLLRIALQGVLIVQQRGGVVGTGSEVERTIQAVLGFILVAYLFLMYCGMGWSLIFEVIETIRQKEETEDKEANLKNKKAKKGQEEKAEQRAEEKSQKKNQKRSQGKKQGIGKQAKKGKEEKGEQRAEDKSQRKQKKGSQGKNRAEDKEGKQPRCQSKVKQQKKPQKVRDAAEEKEEKEKTGKGKDKSCSGSKRQPPKSQSKQKEVKTVANVDELCREIRENKVEEAEMKFRLNKKEDRFLVIRYIEGEKERSDS